MNDVSSGQTNPDRRRLRIGHALLTSRVAQVCEIVAVLLVPLALLAAARLLFGESPMATQVVAPLSIFLMIALAWLGLRLRGQTWNHFGLSLRQGTRRSIVRTFLQSLIVVIGALAAFIGAAPCRRTCGETRTWPPWPRGSGRMSVQYLVANCGPWGTGDVDSRRGAP